MTTVTNMGDAILAAFANGFSQFFAALPSILGALIVLAIGWVVAGWLAGLLTRFLRAIRVNELADRAGVNRFLQRAGVNTDAAGFFAGLLKWYVRLLFVLAAANAVGLTAVSGTINQILAFLPNLAVAAIILGLFAWIASIAKRVIEGAMGGAGLPNARVIGTAAQVVLIGFGVVAAVNQVGIASTLVNTLFTAFVGAIAVAFALAFGLGGRDVAAQIWQDWRTSANQAMAQANPQGAMQGARDQARQVTGQQEERPRQPGVYYAGDRSPNEPPRMAS